MGGLHAQVRRRPRPRGGSLPELGQLPRGEPARGRPRGKDPRRSLLSPSVGFSLPRGPSRRFPAAEAREAGSQATILPGLKPGRTRPAPPLPDPGSRGYVQSPRPAGRAESLADSRRLSADYADFLERHGLYEASWLSPALEEGRRFLAFWPNLYPGFSELKSLLLGSGRFECYGGPAEGFSQESLSVRRYSSAREEYSSVFSACRALIDEGLRPEDIALSVPKLDPRHEGLPGLLRPEPRPPFGLQVGRASRVLPFRLPPFVDPGLSRRGGSPSGPCAPSSSPGPSRGRRAKELTALLRLGERYRIPEAACEPWETMRIWKESLRIPRDEDQGLYSLFLDLSSAAEALGNSPELLGAQGSAPRLQGKVPRRRRPSQTGLGNHGARLRRGGTAWRPARPGLAATCRGGADSTSSSPSSDPHPTPPSPANPP